MGNRLQESNGVDSHGAAPADLRACNIPKRRQQMEHYPETGSTLTMKGRDGLNLQTRGEH
jgi:hypothetical protein